MPYYYYYYYYYYYFKADLISRHTIVVKVSETSRGADKSPGPGPGRPRKMLLLPSLIHRIWCRVITKVAADNWARIN